jgi:hypothetical protein
MAQDELLAGVILGMLPIVAVEPSAFDGGFADTAHHHLGNAGEATAAAHLWIDQENAIAAPRTHAILSVKWERTIPRNVAREFDQTESKRA